MSHAWPPSNMASFDMAASMTASYSLPGNQPIKRLEPSLHKFIKIAIPTDLERLKQHKRNIEKYHKEGSLEKLNAEQNNARRTVQQLKANMREMEKARHQIREEDHPEFDKKVGPVKQEAISAIVQFIELYGSELTPFGTDRTKGGAGVDDEDDGTVRHRHRNEEEHSVYSGASIPEDTTDSNTTDPLADHVSSNLSEEPEDDRIQEQIQTQKQMQAVDESWEDLKQDLEQLNTVIHEFAAHVHGQQEKVDNITDNIDQAQLNVRAGTTMLAKASKLKAVMLPVGGAIIGGALGGPVGLYAGMKIGAVAAFGGSAVGFLSGRFLKRRQNNQVQVELDTLSNDPVQRTESQSNSSEAVVNKDD